LYCTIGQGVVKRMTQVNWENQNSTPRI